MLGKAVLLLEALGIDERIDPLACREFSRLVLLLDARGASPQGQSPAAAFELSQMFVHQTIPRGNIGLEAGGMIRLGSQRHVL
jgi:hypothetical protein